MQIAGFQKSSLTDYPGKLAAVIFTLGCNMKCPYCHNKSILSDDAPTINETRVLDYLEKRHDMLDAVVITGGEPTLQPDLPDFIDAVRRLGYLVKLDTNGTNPEMLLMLIKTGRLDYVAMDIKAPFEKYSEIVGCEIDTGLIEHSIGILGESSVNYELRTTFAPALSVEDIGSIASSIKGAARYCLQQYRKVEPTDPEPHTREEIEQAVALVKKELGFCKLREALLDSPQ